MTARARLSLLGLAVALLAAASATHAATPSSFAPNDLVLRLSDLGPGFEMGDPGCNDFQLDDDITTHALRGFAERFPHKGCQIDFGRRWTVPGGAPTPFYVTGAVFLFRDAAGPPSALTKPRALASTLLGLPPSAFGAVRPIAGLGDAAVEVDADGRASIAWRSGSMLGVMIAEGRDQRVATNGALRFASVQQSRMVAPTPLPPDANDDLEVALDDPRLGVPVYWLGRRLPARGRLPHLSLAEVPELLPSDRRGGLRAELRYGLGLAFVHIELIDPAVLRWRRELRQVAHDPCVRVARIAIPHGRGTIYRDMPSCPEHAHDVFGIAHLPGVTVLAAPDSFGPIHRPGLRYDSLAGMRRILRALRPREQTPLSAP